MDDKHPREDYLELIHLAAIMVGLPVVSSIRRPGGLFTKLKLKLNLNLNLVKTKFKLSFD